MGGGVDEGLGCFLLLIMMTAVPVTSRARTRTSRAESRVPGSLRSAVDVVVGLGVVVVSVGLVVRAVCVVSDVVMVVTLVMT